MDLEDLTEQEDHPAQQVSVDALDPPESPLDPDDLDDPALLVHADPLVLEENPPKLEALVSLVFPAVLVFLDELVSLELMDLVDLQETLALPANPEMLDPVDLLETLVLEDPKDHVDLLVSQAPLVHLVLT